MEVKRGYALHLNQVLQVTNQIFDHSKPISGQCLYMRSWNLKKTEDERKFTIEAFPYDDKYLEYDERRCDLIRSVAPNGNVAKLDADTRCKLDNDIASLTQEYKECIDAEKEIKAQRDEFLAETINIDLRTVALADVPAICAWNAESAWDILDPIVRDDGNVVTMNVKRGYLRRLAEVLRYSQLIFAHDEPISPRFLKMRSWNISIAESEEKLLDEAFPTNERYQEYEMKYHTIEESAQSAVKVVGPEERKDIDARLEKLKEEYADAIAAEVESNAQRNAFLDEMVEVKLRKIAIDDIPAILSSNAEGVWDILDTIIDTEEQG